MADIRVKDLPLATGPTAPTGTDFLAIDGLTTRKTPISALGDVAVPVASQAEAEAGVNATKRMVPVTVKQSIASEVGVTLASAAQGALADSSVQPADLSAVATSGAYSDLTGKPTLGNSASRNVGTAAGTVASGDDSRIVGALQPLTRIQTKSQIIRGDNISDPLWASRIGDFSSGQRGPLFVWNNPSPTDYAIGKNMGGQIWVGDNPTATPDISAPVALSVAIANGNDRTSLYGLNIVAGNAEIGGDTTYKDGFVAGLEVNLFSGFAATVTDAFVGGNRKNGIEIYGQQGPGGRLTAALMIGVNDTSGNVWWSEGIAVSRAVSTGLRFTKNPGGVADGISAFQNAAILDESGSTHVLKVANSHTSVVRLDVSAAVDRVIDLDANPTLNYFVKGKSSTSTTLRFDNSANQAFDINFGSGLSSAQQSQFIFSDRTVAKWAFIKNTSNALAIFDYVGGIAPIFLDGNTTNAVQIRVGGADKRIEVGATDSGGTGYKMLRVLN